MTRGLVWFRSDLRVGDNRALHQASRCASKGVVGVFVICPAQWRLHDWAEVKVEFLLRNLACLSEALKKLNIPLLIAETAMFEGVPALLLNLARHRRCDTLLFNREYEVNERRRDQAVRALFEREGLRVAAFDDQTVVPPDAIRTKAGDFYTVFTPFQRTWVAIARDATEALPLSEPRRRAALVCAPDPLPERVDGFNLERGQAELWPAGEKHALRQLDNFVLHRIEAYQRRRDLPAIDATSRLSPYLSLGVISPRQCLHAAREANLDKLDAGRAGASTWISELVWREFYRHVLVGFPRVSMHRAFRRETDELDWRTDEREFQAWCAGRTGVPIVDAGMRQLRQTGWLHNRVRMIVAMHLTKDLYIDWRLGERHFMRHLVDGDLASNNGGWQWSASTGTDAAPYFRIFNPYSQSRKFDAQGDYIRRWVPELVGVDAAALHDPAGLDAVQRRRLDYPAPLCDHRAARERVLAAFKRLSDARR